MQDTNNRPGIRPLLTLFPLESSIGWAEALEASARKLDYRFQRKGPRCDLWKEEDVTHIPGRSVRCVHGFRIGIEDIGQDLKALGIRAHRFYFEEDCDLPTSLPENHLDTIRFSMNYLPVMRIEPAVQMGKRLSLVWDGLGSKPLDLQCHALELERESSMVLGTGVTRVTSRPLDAIRQLGMLHVPESFNVTITARRPPRSRRSVLWREPQASPH